MNDGDLSRQIKQIEQQHEHYIQISSCTNLKELMDKYGNRADLDKVYYQGIQFVPDKEKFIRNHCCPTKVGV